MRRTATCYAQWPGTKQVLSKLEDMLREAAAKAEDE